MSRSSSPPTVGGLLSSVVRAPLEMAKALNPHREQTALARLAFYGTLAALVATEVVEPPVAVLVGLGHALATSRSPVARAVGESVVEAG